ncbi:MAG: sulfatase-like hydrolase/transferase [Anaerolineae bacterium]|nr:sulfatase-like hydrolase/transferase [Anaerolineae bacterium]
MPEESQQRPNILCIVTDQQRADHLGGAGNALLKTPNIDRLATSGMRFTRCYTNDPMCCPARATLWTGHRSSVHGVRYNTISLDPAIPNIATSLSTAGYRTHGVGKFHLHQTSLPASVRSAINGNLALLNPREWPESQELWKGGHTGALPTPYYGLQSALGVGGHGDFVWGNYANWLKREAPQVVRAIEEWRARERPNWQTTGPSHIPAELHHSHWIADRVIDFLEEQAYSQQPFFCWCSFPDPHHPYHAPEPYHSLYDPAEMPVPARRAGELDDLPPHHRRDQDKRLAFYQRTPEVIARTYGLVTNIDANVGRVLDTLDRLGLRENTVVVYLADHGDLMGDHWLQQKGPFHFSGLLQIPFIWSWPGRIVPGMVNSGIVSLLDFAPTILDLCGVPLADGSPSRDARLPMMRELPPWPGHSLRPLLEGGTQTLQDRVLIEQDSPEHSLRARTLVTERYRITCYAGQEYGELFDLQEDPDELYNLWADPGRRPLRNILITQLLDEMLVDSSLVPS